VEEGAGALLVEVAGGERVDDEGEGDLDGVAVFEGGEVQSVGRGRGSEGTEGAMTGVETGVEEAPVLSFEGGRVAAVAGSEDVATE